MSENRVLLSEQEVADFLRCSRSKVKRLRLDRELNYIPGRPVLIDQADLFAYIETAKIRAIVKEEETPVSRSLVADEFAKGQAAARDAWIKRKLRNE